MPRTLAAAALVISLLGAGGSAVAADQPTAEDCVLYDAAFKAVMEAGPAPEGRGQRRVAYGAWGRPHGVAAGDQTASRSLNLKVCIALNQRIYAHGMTFVARPPLGLRMPGSPPYERFSQPWREDGKTHLTFWFSADDWVDLVMTRGAEADQWTVEKAEYWEGAVVSAR